MKKTLLWAAAAVALCSTPPPPVAAADLALIAVRATLTPVVDGAADAAWNAAPETTVRLAGGHNTPEPRLSMRAMYDDERVYFLFRWNDPTESLAWLPWEKQADGTWKRLASGQREDETEFYEDGIALMWAIRAPSFIVQGPRVTFAPDGIGQGKPAGVMVAPKGELLDLWQWKATRTNPVGQADDGHLDDTPWSPQNVNAGRKADPRQGGGYEANTNAAKSGPAFMAAAGRPGTNWIAAADRILFVDSFKTGDRVASILVSPFVGDRGDISARGTHGGGMWTLEMSRKRDTGSAVDVQFTDIAQDYHFAVAIFDAAQIRHAVSDEVIRLKFAR